jgi:hypothetical protein
MKKKEKTFARKQKIIALSMPLIALLLILLALPVSLAGAPASMDYGTPMILDPQSTAAPGVAPISGTYKEPVGSLFVTSDPSGADVYLNDIHIGITPLKHTKIPSGYYFIDVEKEGYESYFEYIWVEPDETVEVSGVLTSILKGNITATSEPSEADVYLDDLMYVGTTPVVFNASAGLRDILFVKEGYESYSTYISVKPGETVEVKAVLSSTLAGNLTGKISAISDPSGADVSLDYDYVGTTPVVFNASAGYHVIDFEKEGYYSDYSYITVIPGETVIAKGELMWMGADVILGVVIILIPSILIILFFYYLFRRSKKNTEYRLEQEKKIKQLDTDSYSMGADIVNIEIELKRIAEFMETQPRENPYVAGGAVNDPRFWIGNDDVINRVLASIRRNHFFIRGKRRSGKTTLLMQISRALEMKIDPKVRFIPVYLSLQGIPPEIFFERLYKAIVNKVNMIDIEEPEKIVDVEDFINAISYIIESINNSSSIKSVIVLLLDEIECFHGPA